MTNPMEAALARDGKGRSPEWRRGFMAGWDARARMELAYPLYYSPENGQSVPTQNRQFGELYS